MEEVDRPLTIIGKRVQSGVYILWIRAEKALAVAFGRFRGGKALSLSAGDYLYVGSAMGKKGPHSLARRLVRHATRSGNRPPHPLRAGMLRTFSRCGMGSSDLRPRQGKTMHWNADYLLDLPAATLTHVLVLRSPHRLEGALAALVADKPYTSVPARGLGGGDAPGETHLFGVTPVDGWWEDLLADATHLLAQEEGPE